MYAQTTFHATLFRFVPEDKRLPIVVLKPQLEFQQQQQQQQLAAVCTLSILPLANQPPANYFPVFPVFMFTVSGIRGPVCKNES